MSAHCTYLVIHQMSPKIQNPNVGSQHHCPLDSEACIILAGWSSGVSSMSKSSIESGSW
jgi:hypothetical protein